MDIESIKKRVARIEKMRGDDETAHSAEDALFMDFIMFVSKTAHEPLASMAKEVLKTLLIDFNRWCA